MSHELKRSSKYAVDTIESERGWGRKVEDTDYFDTLAEASDFSKAYNAKHNTAAVAPDWYMATQAPRPLNRQELLKSEAL